MTLLKALGELVTQGWFIYLFALFILNRLAK